MRLDKYLKVSRLIKRRTLAKRVADQGRITINDNVAKASSNISVGDIVAIAFGQNLVTVKVLSVKEIVRKNEADTLYELIKEEKINQE